MYKNKILILVITILIFSIGILYIYHMKNDALIKITIYPSSGGFSETYYFEFNSNGKLLVEKGDRVTDDLTQTPFIQKENPYKDRKNVVYEFQSDKTRLSVSETKKIYGLINEMYEKNFYPEYHDVYDSWDIQILYKEKTIMQNCFNEWGLLQDLIDELISVSPITVNLRSFA